MISCVTIYSPGDAKEHFTFCNHKTLRPGGMRAQILHLRTWADKKFTKPAQLLCELFPVACRFAALRICAAWERAKRDLLCVPERRLFIADTMHAFANCGGWVDEWARVRRNFAKRASPKRKRLEPRVVVGNRMHRSSNYKKREGVVQRARAVCVKTLPGGLQPGQTCRARPTFNSSSAHGLPRSRANTSLSFE